MRIDLPTCGLKTYEYCFDGNCMDKNKYDKCEFAFLKNKMRVNIDCKWCHDEICVNADCPVCCDYCPVVDYPGVCKFEDRSDGSAAD